MEFMKVNYVITHAENNHTGNAKSPIFQLNPTDESSPWCATLTNCIQQFTSAADVTLIPIMSKEGFGRITFLRERTSNPINSLIPPVSIPECRSGGIKPRNYSTRNKLGTTFKIPASGRNNSARHSPATRGNKTKGQDVQDYVLPRGFYKVPPSNLLSTLLSRSKYQNTKRTLYCRNNSRCSA